MSKIFDALRRAENERRKSVRGEQKALTAAEARPAVSESGGAFEGFNKDLLRELGILRNSLDRLFIEKPRRTLLFASSTPGEGTTTVSTNFARFLALQGIDRVLACEMNTRNPSFAKIFSMNGGLGMADYFSGETSLPSLVQNTPVKKLDVVHAGMRDPSLIQLHINRVFPKFLEAARGNYETVIFDGPPILSYPETPSMSAFVDGVVLVMRAGRTKREVVLRALELIENFNGTVLGVVLNRKKYYIPSFIYKRL